MNDVYFLCLRQHATKNQGGRSGLDNAILLSQEGLGLYTRYPIVARALGLAAVQPLGRVRARAKVSCIQGLGLDYG